MPGDLVEEIEQLTRTGHRAQRPDWLTEIRHELAQYVIEMKAIRYMEPDEAMGWLSSVSARVLELILETVKSEGRVFTKLRVEELLPLREETRFQYQIASRRLSNLKLEFDLAGGQAT